MGKRNKNTFSKALGHLKSRKIDEKLQMLSERPANSTMGYMTIDPTLPNPDFVSTQQGQENNVVINPDLTIGDIKKLQFDDRSLSDADWIKQGKLHAVGKYQFIGNTLPEVAKKAGIPDTAKFSSRVQDTLALQLMKDRGIEPWVGPSDKATKDERAIIEKARQQDIKIDPALTNGCLLYTSPSPRD